MKLNHSAVYDAAFTFAAKKHDGKIRIGGDPYITHPKAVAEIVQGWGYGEEYQIAALFHDLLEDTDASEEEIRAVGGESVLEAVKLLTVCIICAVPLWLTTISSASIFWNPSTGIWIFHLISRRQ